MILAGMWDFYGGLSRPSLSYWGKYESSFSFCGDLFLGVLPTQAWGDASHHQYISAHLRLLHVGLPLAMSYSHLLMKERTAPPWDYDRIWNSFLMDDYFFPFDCWTSLLFDCTLGFPGEGPRWTIISANVDSFNTNVNCLHWEADAFLTQEARLAESNMIDAQRKAALSNLHVFCSQPLHRIRASNGQYRILSGGTATCASREVTKLFDAKDDVSGTWSLLCSTARATATWHQVTANVKLLAFNFYAIANAPSERTKFERDNELLHQLFTVAAQFSDIPIALAGDFQMEPGVYPAVQLALDHWGWADPLLQTDAQGIVTRPPTFFQHNPVSETEGQSSIDGILVNRTALTALIGMEVLQHQDRQHRPIRATFIWDRVHQIGSVLQKVAKMNLAQVQKADPDDPGCPVQLSGEQLWHTFDREFESAVSADEKWQVYNAYAVQLLQDNGAQWEKGPRIRGSTLKFQAVRQCTLQDASGSCASPYLLLLRAILRSLRELEFRFHRVDSGPGDSRTFRNTQHKLLRRLKVAQLVSYQVKQIFVHDLPHLVELVLHAAQQELRQIKIAAIQKWRESMKDATASMTIGKIVYQFLKSKGRVTPPNLVEDDTGNIIYDPQTAMDTIAAKWDSVFSANADHEHEMLVLKQVWPYIHDKGRGITLPPIDEHQLCHQAARRRPDAAAGLDGWQTHEIQALPPSAFRPVARLFNQIEAGCMEFPTVLTQVRSITRMAVMLPFQRGLFLYSPCSPCFTLAFALLSSNNGSKR